MSLALKKLECVNVKDPRVCVTGKTAYAVLEGASQVSQKVYTTTSVSQSSLQFSCPPPSGNNFIDRRVYVNAPVRLTFTAVSTANGQRIINLNEDAPRQFGFLSAVDVVNCSINNFSVSNNIADYLHALLKYNNDDEIKGRLYSTSPSYADQSALYSSLFGATRNPLGLYCEGTDNSNNPRGAFTNYNIAQNDVSTAAGQTLTALVDIVFFEQFMLLSPLYWGKEETHPLVHVNTIDFNITMLNQAANRMWSRMDNFNPSIVNPLPLSNLSYTFATLIPSGAPAFSFGGSASSPSIQFTYFTPKETQIVPRDMISCYSYTDILRFPTDFTYSYASGAINRVSSNNIQLSSIPRRIYVYARRRNASLFASPTLTDSFLGIESISCQYFNRTGLLSSASKQQLYEISVRNHCNLTWDQWSGQTTYAPNLTKYQTIGSVLCIDPACDFGLDSLAAPGKIDHTTLQMDVTLSSNLGGLSPQPLDYSLYIVVCNEGVFNVGPGVGQASGQIGVLSSQDILEARSRPGITYSMVQDVNGGNFFTGIKDFFMEKVLPVIKESKIASNLANLIPFAGPAISESLRNLGYGEGGVLVNEGCGDSEGYGDGVHAGVYAGTTAGGRMMKRKGHRAMRKRVAM